MSINRIAFYHIETLLWIARLGTFGAAAERLKTTQPAISARVRELEHHLGTSLFRREGRTMTLTPAGRQLVRESEPLMAGFQSLLHSAGDTAETAGIVRIGAGEIAAASCLPGFVAELQRTWPNLSLEIEIALTADLIQQILTGRTDLVFGAGRIAHPALRTTSIGAVDLLLLASPTTIGAIEAQGNATNFPIWSLSSHSPLYHIMKQAIAASGITSRSVNLCNNARMMIDIVAAGGGIGIFPHSMVRQALEDGALALVPGAMDIPPVEFQVAIRAGETDPLILHIFERAGQLDIRAMSTPLAS
ncbi:LysR family transcriptional regulator [Sphingobium sp. DEHP117]|uniref:LysR family transcriptional regulator n=1 Tax=Sphingobium sp. DEHP117 TaxID=2993436 RepID=UPI0027D52D40|nr:LysR substrate-binding domain-containing protein [Sphingobium sp. DEHP117]MDQ4421810.1 LysR family transcriptional regulator [Sphingobium sp. DEHP117]